VTDGAVTGRRLLVTGASGFVGAAVVRLAVQRGDTVIALVGPRSDLARLESVRREIEVARADITDGRALSEVVGLAAPDACVHLAARGAVVREDDLTTLLAANAAVPAALAQALAAAGAGRLVTAGSSSEYGSVRGAMEEASAARPDDFYGVAKLAGGLLARIVGARCGLETVHLRLFSVYGPGEDRRRLVPSMIDALLGARPLALTPGEQVRDFVYVDDVAEALLEATHRPGLDGHTLNVGTGVQTSVRQLGAIVADQLGGHQLLRFGERPYRPDERFSWRAGTVLTERTLGWTAGTPLAEGIARAIEASRGTAAARMAA
jgi:UDP-glucose 4-epimerase